MWVSLAAQVDESAPGQLASIVRCKCMGLAASGPRLAPGPGWRSLRSGVYCAGTVRHGGRRVLRRSRVLRRGLCGRDLGRVGDLPLVVHRPVGQQVGALVGLAGDVLEDDLLEAVSQLAGLGVQRDQRRALHLVAAAQLADDQLGVGPHHDAARPEGLGVLQPGDDAAVLGDVVGRPADALAQLCQHVAGAGGGDQRTVAGGTGVAARATVGPDDELLGGLGGVAGEAGAAGSGEAAAGSFGVRAAPLASWTAARVAVCSPRSFQSMNSTPPGSAATCSLDCWRPSSSSQVRSYRRPLMPTRQLLARYLATVSASTLRTMTSTWSTSGFLLPPAGFGRVTARWRMVTGAPSEAASSSGSSVRRPVRTTTFRLAMVGLLEL